MGGILSTGISALAAFQNQLTTTGHNIANVNTEGYSRQRVELDVRAPEATGAGFLGTGVEAVAIRRDYDDFLAGQVREFNAAHSEFLVFHERSLQVDDVLADATAGIDQLMSDFFAGTQDLADDPTSIPARQVLLNRAESLADRFQALSRWMDGLRNQVTRDFRQYTEDMSNIADSIASINSRIQAARVNSEAVPNDLLDERDHLVDQLSGYTNVSTLTQDDGSMNVFVGTGQALVVGSTSNRLTMANNAEAADHQEIILQQTGGTQVNVTAQMTGGKLGGLLRFRNEVLDPAQNALGRVAIGLGVAFNAEHTTGMDLDGQPGGNFFRVAEPEVLGNPANAGTADVSIANVSQLGTDEYQLSFDGTDWTLTNLRSGSDVAMSGTGTALDPFLVDGLSIEVSAASAAGDTYRLRPTRLGASAIDLAVRDPRDIAAGESLIAENNTANTGTGRISFGAQVTSEGSALPAAPVVLTFDATTDPANPVFNVSTGGTIAYNPATDSGKTLSVNIPGLGDFSFTVTGTPDNTDSFRIGLNTGGVGDNRNALRLTSLQSQSFMVGGTASLSETYAQMIGDVGTRTRQAELNESVQDQLLTQARENKAAVSGVNLDEEAANLIRFQQAFQAAAQVINTANTLFDTLLGAVRR